MALFLIVSVMFPFLTLRHLTVCHSIMRPCLALLEDVH